MAINSDRDKSCQQELIARLIGKLVIGTITDEERKALDAWRGECAENDAVVRRLQDTAHLAKEYRRRRTADYHRPLDDMRRRLGLDAAPSVADINSPVADINSSVADATHGKARALPLYRWAAAVAAMVLLIAGGAYLSRSYWMVTDSLSASAPDADSTQQMIAKTDLSQSQDLITPGSTQAVLTLGNGAQIPLGADSKANKAAIDKATAPKGMPCSISTPRGGEFKVTLEDGTEVWLNAASRLRYPETFGGKERRVELEGEAYFKVAKDQARPFYVVSGGQEVRVYGTEFNIHAYSDEPKVYTTLISGSIALRPASSTQGSELVLTPGHQAVFDKSTASASVHREDLDMVLGWRNGVFVFENQDMRQIMRTLSRWYNFDYEFADKRVAKVEFMGSVPRYGSFQEVASIFGKAAGIRFTFVKMPQAPVKMPQAPQGGKVIVSAK